MRIDPVSLANEASSAGDLEKRVLALLAREVGYDVAFMTLVGEEPTTVGLDVATMARVLAPESAHERDILPVKAAALARRGVAVDTDVLGEEAVRRTRYHRELAAPIGGKHSLFALLSLRGRVLGALMLGRTGTTFAPVEVARVEELLPALSLARASFGLQTFHSRPLPPRPALSRLFGRTAERRGDLSVEDRGGFREMVARDARTGARMVWSRAAIEEPSRSGWPYVDLFHLAAAVARERRRALFVGCGGGVAPRRCAELHPGVAIDVVDCAPEVFELARAWYALDEIPRLTTHVDDGLRFLARAAPSTWDVVVVDAFDAVALPDGLAQRATFAVLRDVLRPGGAFALNVIGALDGRGPVAEVLEGARASFDDLRVVPVMTADEDHAPATRRNVVVVGRRT